MADDNIIIEGNVKFREGRKWKSRWCVMRRLSPVADAVQLTVRSAACGGRTVLALSLTAQQWVSAESGFTLDRHSHTLALVCRDAVPVLAFDSPERLLLWQVKVSSVLGTARSHVVMVAAGSGGLAAGPARLMLRAGRMALTAGTPPQLLGLWEIKHLRRYGVVDGRFCFEGGSLCGRGAGLHVLLCERAGELLRDVRGEGDNALPVAGRGRHGACVPPLRPDTRRSQRPDDADSEEEGKQGGAQWRGGLQRCASCSAGLGGGAGSMRRAAGGAGARFSPAWTWTMDALCEAAGGPPCPCRPPPGPYGDYDVPKVPSAEVEGEGEGEHYDTPRRLSGYVVPRSSTAECLLPAPCGGAPCRAVSQWAASWLRRGAARQPQPALYATVDVTRKPRRRPPHYENVQFAQYQDHYENAPDLSRGAPPGPLHSHEQYLEMAPLPPHAGYTPMSPARCPPGRAASDPALAEDGAAAARRRSRSADSAWCGVGGRGGAEGGLGSGSSLHTLREAPPPPHPPPAGCRDSSSSNDSGVSSCSRRGRARAAPEARSRSSEAPPCPAPPPPPRGTSSAEAEVPLLTGGPLGSAAAAGVLDSRSTSSGTSDLSDYIETLSICSSHSHSSIDTPLTLRTMRAATSTLRPRSGNEYLRLRPPPGHPPSHTPAHIPSHTPSLPPSDPATSRQSGAMFPSPCNPPMSLYHLYTNLLP